MMLGIGRSSGDDLEFRICLNKLQNGLPDIFEPTLVDAAPDTSAECVTEMEVVTVRLLDPGHGPSLRLEEAAETLHQRWEVSWQRGVQAEVIHDRIVPDRIDHWFKAT